MSVATTQLGTDNLMAAAHAAQYALERDPENPALIHDLGQALSQLGQHDLALQLYGQALARAPHSARYHASFGISLAQARHETDARDELETAIRLDPTLVEARAALANLELDAGNVVGAGFLLDPVMSDAPELARALGRIALAEARWEEATAQLLTHLRHAPADAPGFFYLGVALQSREMLEPAAASYRQAVALDPNLFEAHANLSTALGALGEHADALFHAEQAVRLMPDRAGVYLNRANARRDLGDAQGAVEDLRRAVALDPNYAEAWSSLGNVYHDLAELSLALDAHATAVRLAPHLAQARWNRSFTLLAAGHLALGWDEYEARRGTAAARPEPRDFPWPLWSGESLQGQRVLVWREQGLGDELLFLTCLPDLLANGAHVTLLANPRLESLIKRALPDAKVRADHPGAVSASETFDFQVPIGTLPRWVRRERSAFPPAPPVRFTASESSRADWAARLDGLGPGRRIGLCWRSGLVTPERRRHYAPLGAWETLLRTPGVQWINLQYDDCEEELLQMEAAWGIRVHRWPGVDLKHDLESVVALLAQLDGVVTAPTAVSSLAGLIGVPTWQVDSGSDWTTFGESRSPWFPSIELFRRGAGDGDQADWSRVMAQVARAVAR